ncbi:MAG TPA: ABC transporter ATP-binding protein [Methylomirabilota bacterium]|nr:ABC transporter ATP-binding protein [Methylomirabilota bacterium]
MGQEVAPPPKLALAGLSKRFGGLRAVSACSFDIAPGSVVGLIGPNGSGKSTVFNLVTGLLRPDEGAILYDGRRIDGLSTHEIARRGIGRTFQAVKIFRDLPVRENLAIAAMGRRLHGWEPRAREWLGRMGLGHLADTAAGSLSIGQQRLLELTMNLVIDPEFLLLDEPLAGVHPVVRRRIGEILSELRARGRTLLIIEHHMPFVMGLCDKIVVMDHGEKIAEGPPAAIRADARVIAALLGRAEGGGDDARA